MENQSKQYLNILIKNVQNKPGDADAWEVLADYLAEHGEDDKAAKCYRKVLSLRPDDLEAQINLEKLTHEEESESLLEEITGFLNPDSLRSLQVPPIIQVLFAVMSFLITLVLAEIQQWQVTDLVWSLWISSLVLGYAYLITGIITAGVHGSLSLSSSGKTEGKTTLHLPAIFLVFIALFMLGFFTIHFGMFHFVHSVFLNSFFPIVGDGLGFPNPFAMISYCLQNYWSIILLSALTQLPNFLNLINHPKGDFMTMPYKNVVKMHLSIFVFAGLSFMQVDGMGLYYLLIVYFFPFEAVKMLFPSKEKKKVESAL